MMSSYSELTSDVQVVFREWQSQASREAHHKRINETHDDGGQEKVRHC